MTAEVTNVDVRSDELAAGELKNISHRVNSMKSKGYSNVAILYFLAQEGHTVIGTTENDQFVIKVIR